MPAHRGVGARRDGSPETTSLDLLHPAPRRFSTCTWDPNRLLETQINLDTEPLPFSDISQII